MVIVACCPRESVGEVVRQLRARYQLIIAEPAATVRQTFGHDDRDADRVVAWLRHDHGLTNMQCVVLALRFRYWKNAAVAKAIGVAVGTIKAHVHAAKLRMGAAKSDKVDALFRRRLRKLGDAGDVRSDSVENSEWTRMLARALRVATPEPELEATPPPLGPPHPRGHRVHRNSRASSARSRRVRVLDGRAEHT